MLHFAALLVTLPGGEGGRGEEESRRGSRGWRRVGGGGGVGGKSVNWPRLLSTVPVTFVIEARA